MTDGIVGREHELSETHGFLADIVERPCALLLVGAAGIGKTAVWSATVDEARRRGYTVISSRPAEAEADLPFTVLGDVLSTVSDAHLGALPEVRRQALEQALLRASATSPVHPTAVALATVGVLRSLAREAPTVIALDDLQWVDAPSLRVLKFAWRRLGDARIGVIATARTEPGVTTPVIEMPDPGSVGRLEISGLGRRHLAQLVHERTGRMLSPSQLSRLATLSGGNPMYALELVDSRDPHLLVPESLAAALHDRLATLSREARRAGLAAALLGRVDETGLAIFPDTALDELRGAGVIDPRGGALRFTHPLLASAFLDLHTDGERRAVHLALADVLTDPDERAMHLGRGTETPSEQVATMLEQAAARLDARGAPESAAILAERAAALTPPGDTRATTRRLIMTADLYQACGESQAHVLPLLERLVATLPAGVDRARVLVRIGWVGAQIDSLTNCEALAYQERALAEAPRAPDVVAAAHAVLARQLSVGGDYPGSLRHATLAVAAGGDSAGGGTFPSPYGELGMARLLSGEGLDTSLFERGIEMESRLPRLEEPYQSVACQYALALLYAGDLTRARSMLLSLLASSVELDRIRSIAGCVLHLIELEVRAGHLAQAEAYAAEFVHLDRQLRGHGGGRHLIDEWYPSGIVAMHLGRTDVARRVLTSGVEYSRQIESPTWLAHHLWALGHLELSLDNLMAAREALFALPRMLRETGMGEWSAHPVHPDIIETLVALGEIRDAIDLRDELAEYATRLGRPWGLATAARSTALIESATGHTQAALEAIEESLAAHERLDWPFEHARTLLVAGMLLRRLGRRRDAGSALDEAKAIFTSLRNPLWLARVTAETRRLGGRRATKDALTPTEHRVARLAAEGRRNTEIAAALYVTPKTVEATLSRVYRKLGVRSRTELARVLPASESHPPPGMPSS